MARGARVGAYAERYTEGTNVVLLDPDVARAFKDSASVNAALRLIIEAASLTRGGVELEAGAR